MQLRNPQDEVLLVQSVVLGELEKMAENFTCKINRRTSKQYVLVKTEFIRNRRMKTGTLYRLECSCFKV